MSGHTLQTSIRRRPEILIFLNVIGSFVFSIILVIIFLLGYTTESGLRNKTKAVIETIQEVQNEQMGDSTQIK